VRSQEAFDRVLASTSSQDWAHDRIHPNLAGHAVLADAFLAVLE
jgi:lysophospholipase L1-like esterase